jgi:hypothetical protein
MLFDNFFALIACYRNRKRRGTIAVSPHNVAGFAARRSAGRVHLDAGHLITPFAPFTPNQ